MNFKLALVTGASSGIGKSLCYLLASKGINLLITGRNESELNKIAQDLQSKVNVSVLIADLGKTEDCKKLVHKIHAEGPDLIINNAGLGLYGEALSHETQTQLEMVDIDCKAVLQITLEGARTLVSRGETGVIVNVSSAAAFFVFPCFAVYSASKAFVKHLSESLDEEFKEYGIRVLASCPGVVGTKFRARAALEDPNIVHGGMSSEFAAQEIWDQIEKEKTVHVFDWKYRRAIFLSRFIPKSMLMKSLRASIENRHQPRPIIKLTEEK